jgi:hypothetical protein
VQESREPAKRAARIRSVSGTGAALAPERPVLQESTAVDREAVEDRLRGGRGEVGESRPDQVRFTNNGLWVSPLVGSSDYRVNKQTAVAPLQLHSKD